MSTAMATTLDDTDRAIVLFIHSYRRQRGAGPTWREVREATGLKPIDTGLDRFEKWWSNGGQQTFARSHSLDRVRLRHPTFDDEQVEKERRRWGYKVWIRRRKERDPLALRLRRLADLGYVSFSTEERSLDIGPVVQAWKNNNNPQRIRSSA